jgi:iron complex transport system substrate-binding protein
MFKGTARIERLKDGTLEGTLPRMPATRIVSLLPGATEMVVALGAESRLVGLSHECDWPPSVQHLPRVTTTPIDGHRSSCEIDAQVRSAVATGTPVIGIDRELLVALRPDLLITQVLCEVCAVSDGEAIRLAQALPDPPHVVALHGTTLATVLDDVVSLSATLQLPAAGSALRQELLDRVSALETRYSRPDPPTVVVIEWLEPCFLAGHWTPEVVSAAGGRDIGMLPGQHSVARDWNEVCQLDPEVVVIALCGFSEARAHAELDGLARADVRRWLQERRVVVIDCNAYTSRAGPRLVEAIEVLGALLKP